MWLLEQIHLESGFAPEAAGAGDCETQAAQRVERGALQSGTAPVIPSGKVRKSFAKGEGHVSGNGTACYFPLFFMWRNGSAYRILASAGAYCGCLACCLRLWEFSCSMVRIQTGSDSFVEPVYDGKQRYFAGAFCKKWKLDMQEAGERVL